MIVIEKSENYRCCNVCYSQKNVYNVTFLYNATNSGIQVALCKKCLEELTEKIHNEMKENENDTGRTD